VDRRPQIGRLHRRPQADPPLGQGFVVQGQGAHGQAIQAQGIIPQRLLRGDYYFG
jgi:hypothetical protein